MLATSFTCFVINYITYSSHSLILCAHTSHLAIIPALALTSSVILSIIFAHKLVLPAQPSSPAQPGSPAACSALPPIGTPG